MNEPANQPAPAGPHITAQQAQDAGQAIRQTLPPGTRFFIVLAPPANGSPEIFLTFHGNASPKMTELMILRAAESCLSRPAGPPSQ